MYARTVSASLVAFVFSKKTCIIPVCVFSTFERLLRNFFVFLEVRLWQTSMCGNLSVKCFCPAAPSDKKSTHAIFLSAACLFKLLMSPAILGFCSVTSRKISFTEIEYFALAATINRSHQSSHSVLGAIFAVSKKLAAPPQLTGPVMSSHLRYLAILAAPCCSCELDSIENNR